MLDGTPTGDDDDDDDDGFGVTPALLSTGGARMVLGRLKELYGEERYISDWVSQWGMDGRW